MAASLLTRLSDDHPLQPGEDALWEADEKTVLIDELLMVLTSRPRLPGISTLPLINTSVLNYGFDGSFQQDDDGRTRHQIIGAHLRHTLLHFEPRLSAIQLSVRQHYADHLHFTLDAYYAGAPFTLELIWDDYSGRFSVNG